MKVNRKKIQKKAEAIPASGKRITVAALPDKESLFLSQQFITLLLIFFGVILYAGTFTHGFVLDDITVIGQNRLVQQGIRGIPELLQTSYWFGYDGSTELGYRPLSLVMFAIEWELFPGKPGVHHIMNVLIYAFTGGLLFITLKRLFKNCNQPLLLAIVLLFIAHPVHTEVVANIKSRDELLSFFFSIAAIYFLAAYLDKYHFKNLIYSLISFFLALISKENSITILALIPVIIYFISNAPVKSNIRISACYAALAAGYILLRYILPEGFSFRKEIPIPDNTLLAAPDMAVRLATAINILGRYLLLLIFPHPLISDYSFKHIPLNTWKDLSVLVSFCIHIFLICYALLKLKNKNIAAFGILFYLITFSIVSNIFFNVGATLAERFLYMPSLGFSIVTALVLAKLFKADILKEGRIINYISRDLKFFSALVIIIAFYSIKTIERNRSWKDNLTLFSADVAKAPNSTKLNYYYATSLIEVIAKGDYPDKAEGINDAIGKLDKALNIFPGFVEAREELGYAYYLKGDYTRAADIYQSALQHGSHSEKLFNNYGVALIELQKYNEAETMLQKAIVKNPGYSEAYNNLGIAYSSQRLHQQAIAYFEKAIALNPRYGLAYKNAGRSYGNIKNFDKALSHFNKALELIPDDPDLNLYIGLTYQYKGDFTAARKYFDEHDRRSKK